MFVALYLHGLLTLNLTLTKISQKTIVHCVAQDSDFRRDRFHIIQTSIFRITHENLLTNI